MFAGYGFRYLFQNEETFVGRVWILIPRSGCGEICWQSVDFDISFRVRRLMLVGCGIYIYIYIYIYLSGYEDLCWQDVDSDISFRVKRFILEGCGIWYLCEGEETYHFKLFSFLQVFELCVWTSSLSLHLCFNLGQKSLFIQSEMEVKNCNPHQICLYFKWGFLSPGGICENILAELISTLLISCFSVIKILNSKLIIDLISCYVKASLLLYQNSRLLCISLRIEQVRNL